ncbi:MAG: KOW domain-containing protein [Firmicutes bacterium]|nr:KOW domain-containing protein [Bacillota bacterium]
MGLLEVGQLVTSKRGRDSGRKYVVVKFYDDGHADVVDGLVRKLNRPKRKNVKHLVVHAASVQLEDLDDKAIRDFIERHSCEAEVRKEGLQDHGQG